MNTKDEWRIRMEINSIELLRNLSNAYGVSGFEDDVVNIIKERFGHIFNIKEDSMRNLVIYRKNHKGNIPVVMLDAHSLQCFNLFSC